MTRLTLSVRADGCPAETTIVGIQQLGILNITLEWPEADLGKNVILQCPCGDLSDAEGATISRFASRVCGGTFSMGAEWEASMDTDCDLSITTRRLCQVANVSQQRVLCQCETPYCPCSCWMNLRKPSKSWTPSLRKKGTLMLWVLMSLLHYSPPCQMMSCKTRL